MVQLTKPKWHRIPEDKKKLPLGLLLAANFEGSSLEQYAYILHTEKYGLSSPNGGIIQSPTHYMTTEEVKTLLETLEKD